MPNFGLGRQVTNGNEPNRAPVNWRRGFTRIWVLLSVAWMMGWGIYFAIEGLQGSFTGHPGAVMVILAGPPMALLLLGLAAAWALRGFAVEP